MSNTSSEQKRLIPVTQWNDFHTWPPIGGLRHLIFNEETNGFKSAFKRVGSRVLVDENEFFVCVDQQNNEVDELSSKIDLPDLNVKKTGALG